MDKLNPGNNRFYLSRKLIGVVTIFLIAASGLVVLTNFSINMIATTGDYMRLLSTWSEQHHKSMVSLERYVRSGEQSDFQTYVESADEVENNSQIIDEFFEADPEVEVIFDSFKPEDIYPNEISSLLFAFRHFRNSERVQNIYRQWEQLNRIQEKKQEFAQLIQKEWSRGEPDQEQLNKYLVDLNTLSQNWNIHSRQLMDEVGTSSAVIKRAGLWISVILGILLVLIGIVVTVRANKSIGRWEHTLNEKEVLLSEIHHRVKNNMAVISGLLELESMQSQNPEQALQDSRNRIQSMAMIHEVLYQSESFSEINLSQYLEKLINYISDTYIRDHKNISLQTHFDSITLNINQAVPLGLIVNEMVVNAITHRFGSIENGEVTLLLSELDEKVSLSIKDNGKRLPQDFSFESAESSGLMIVKTLVHQLDADVTFNNGNEITFNLQFNKSNASGSNNASL